MARKKNTDFSSSNFDFLGKEMKKLLDEIKYEVSEQKEEALTAAAKFVMKKFKANTPTLTGKLKASWVLTKKYKGVRYINNTDILENGIPKLNLVEYSTRHGKPFVRRIFSESEPEMEKIMIDILKGE